MNQPSLLNKRSSDCGIVLGAETRRLMHCGTSDGDPESLMVVGCGGGGGQGNARSVMPSTGGCGTDPSFFHPVDHLYVLIFCKIVRCREGSGLLDPPLSLTSPSWGTVQRKSAHFLKLTIVLNEQNRMHESPEHISEARNCKSYVAQKWCLSGVSGKTAPEPPRILGKPKRSF